MTTVKNYAASVVKSLRKQGVLLSDARHIENNAVHFSIPDDGLIFNDGLKGLRGQCVNLPYKMITIEYQVNHGDKKEACMIYAFQIMEFISVVVFHYDLIDKEWKIVPIICVFPSVIPISEKGQWFELSQKRMVMDEIDGRKSEEILEKYLESYMSHAYCVPELCEALLCKNVETVNIQEKASSNRKRTRLGKLPFYEIKKLIINTKKKIVGALKGGDTHNSPRQHLRRGHIRRLPSGNYWVNSCVVGDSLKGSISKQYVVRNGDKPHA